MFVTVSKMILKKMRMRARNIYNFCRFIGKNNCIQNPDKIHVDSIVLASTLAQGVSTAKNSSTHESSIDRYTSIGRNTKISHSTIGSFCAISWDCTINAISHPITRLTVSAFPYVPAVGRFVDERQQKYLRVNIGNDVWIGAQAVIMPGIRVGDGAVIGAGAIVTKDVKPYEIVAGNPARHLRWRFDPKVVEVLLEIKWWEWPDDKIRRNIHLFQMDMNKELLEALRSA